MHAPGRRGAAAPPDDRRGRVQRGLLHRRAHPRRRAARRRRRGLARLAHDADERAGVDRRRRPAARAAGSIATALKLVAASGRHQDAGRARPADASSGSRPRCCGSPTSGPRRLREGHARARRARSASSLSAELNKHDLRRSCVDLMGAGGMLYPSYEMRRPDTAGQDADDCPQKAFLRIAGQLDRGRHVRDHAQHPRRAGPRPARRRPGRQGAPLVGAAAKLSGFALAGRPTARVVRWTGSAEQYRLEGPLGRLGGARLLATLVISIDNQSGNAGSSERSVMPRTAWLTRQRMAFLSRLAS